MTWQMFLAGVILAGLLPFYVFILVKCAIAWLSGQATYLASRRSQRNSRVNEEFDR